MCRQLIKVLPNVHPGDRPVGLFYASGQLQIGTTPFYSPSKRPGLSVVQLGLNSWSMDDSLAPPPPPPKKKKIISVSSVSSDPTDTNSLLPP